MNRNEFRQYMNEYKQARESNPSLSYWQWKAKKYQNGTDDIKEDNRNLYKPGSSTYARMSGSITPIFDIQDAADLTPKKYTKWFNTIPLLGIPGAVMYSGNKEDNSYAEGSDGVMQSYLLPEIVVTPSEYQNYYMKNIRPKGTPDGEYFLRGLLPEFRTNITKEEQDKVLKNLIDIYEYAGKPTINYNGFRDTAYYIPLFNSMNSIKDTSDLLAELAHPIQRKIGKNNNFIRDGIKNAINRMTGKNTHYVDKNNYEYETHRIIEPKLRQYIRNGNDNLSEYLQK